jgi:hypothetical protein
MALTPVNRPSGSHWRLILQISRPPGFSRNHLGEKISVQVTKQDDQIKPSGFKFVLGGVCYKEVEVEIKFKSGLTELSNRHG